VFGSEEFLACEKQSSAIFPFFNRSRVRFLAPVEALHAAQPMDAMLHGLILLSVHSNPYFL